MLRVMTSTRGARRLVLVAAVVSSLFVLPGLAAAHAELVRAIPADGASVTEPVRYVSGRYTEDLTADSSLRILDASGSTVATGGVDPDDDRVMIARPDAPLTNGTFTVRSTAISQVDGHPERVTWTFTVAIPPTKALPSPTQAASGSVPPPSSEPSPTASPAATPSPSASPAPGDSAASLSDVALPIIAALAIVLIGTGALLSRGRRPGAP
jgi:methionine-rich copper-binding protein CopC